jgi:hypothetical protein
VQVTLNPTFYQVVPLHPVPGTPLWKRLRSERRILQGFSFEQDSIDNFTFELRDAPRDEALGVVSDTYRRLVSEGGPWPFRFTENLLRGYRTLADREDPIYRSRAMAYRKMLGQVLPLAMVQHGFCTGSVRRGTSPPVSGKCMQGLRVLRFIGRRLQRT